MIRIWIWLAAAGAAGTLLRHATNLAAIRIVGPRHPLGTIVVNLLGCFLFGLIWHVAEYRSWIHPQARLVILTGFLGAFTTFSTLAFESVHMLQRGHTGFAMANLIGQNVAGLACVAFGMFLARALTTGGLPS
ncbi:MAG: CrcB family protein [Planctomycetes bacterium]|nr:CrcB family protein [Planctomycetota bacterium]